MKLIVILCIIMGMMKLLTNAAVPIKNIQTVNNDKKIPMEMIMLAINGRDRINVVDTPDEFVMRPPPSIITKPSTSNGQYNAFLAILYQHDKQKVPIQNVNGRVKRSTAIYIPDDIAIFQQPEITGDTFDKYPFVHDFSIDRKNSMKRNAKMVLPREIISVVDTPDEFEYKRPMVNIDDTTYGHFLEHLYRYDTVKESSSILTPDNTDTKSRIKRLILFRPLFVFKKSELKRATDGRVAITNRP